MIITRINLSELFSKIRYYSSIKQNSQWIYSSQSEQMIHGRHGYITLAAIPHNHKDTTLRLHKSLKNAHIILSSSIQVTSKYIKKLSSDFSQEGEVESETLTLFGKSLEKYKQKKPERFESQLQISKQLQLSIENQKIVQSNNDRDNKQLKKQQEQLVKYIEISHFKEKLQDFRNKNDGWPQIGYISQNLVHLMEWKKTGINILFLLEEEKLFASKPLFQNLRQNKVPYEILPTSNSLINTLAASGFPADRFSIQYFPASFHFLTNRKGMKMTLAIAVKYYALKQCLKQITHVYGPSHLIYIEDDKGKIVDRGEIWNILEKIQIMEDGIYRIAVAPYLSPFNESLKEQKDRVSQIKGQIMHQLTHFVKLEFLNQELSQLKRKKDPKQILLYSLFQQLLIKGIPLSKATQIIRFLKPVQEDRLNNLGKLVALNMPRDHIGLAQLSHKQQR